MNVEFDCPQVLACRLGELALNETDAGSSGTLRRYQVLPDGFLVGPTARVTQQFLSQQDGSQMYPRFKTGAVVTMTVRLQVQKSAGSGEYVPACGVDLVEMSDRLNLWLNTMRTQEFGDQQRYVWTPTGKAARMLQNVEVLQWPTPSPGSDLEPEPTVTFALESPFPYAVDESDTTTHVDDGDTEDFLNDGSSDVWPVIKVTSPGSSAVTAFTITNVLTGLSIAYDSSRPSGGEDLTFGPVAYAEIDCFRGSIFRNGDGQDLIPGIVPGPTDFFTLTAELTAPNQLTIVGADMDVTWAKAYS